MKSKQKLSIKRILRVAKVKFKTSQKLVVRELLAEKCRLSVFLADAVLGLFSP